MASSLSDDRLEEAGLARGDRLHDIEHLHTCELRSSRSGVKDSSCLLYNGATIGDLLYVLCGGAIADGLLFSNHLESRLCALLGHQKELEGMFKTTRKPAYNPDDNWKHLLLVFEFADRLFEACATSWAVSEVHLALSGSNSFDLA
jgi:hypothetical protein